MALWLGLNGVLLLVAYLLGAIPTGYWTGRVLKGIDIRDYGSKSTGATNVLRTLGKGAALFVLLVDVAKGALAIAATHVAYHLPAFTANAPASVEPSIWFPWVVTLTGLAAILGHSKSVFINFTGGKSVATGLGVLTTMSCQVGLAALAVFGVMLAIWRFVSLGSIAAAIAACILMVVLQKPIAYQLLTLAAGIYVIWRHQANIQRLLAGTEPKIGQKAQESQPEA